MVNYQKAQRFIVKLLGNTLIQLKLWYSQEGELAKHNAKYYEEWNKDLTKLHIVNMIHYENGELDKIKMPERRNPPEFYDGL